MLLSSFVGLIFWLRFAQTQTLVKAQTLLAKVGDTNSISDINSLRAVQQKLNQVATILDEAPNLTLPGSAYSKVQAEKHKTITRLDTVDQTIKSAENLESAKKMGIEAVNITKKASVSGSLAASKSQMARGY